MNEPLRQYTALISGATGLVGEQLLTLLLNDPAYNKVIAVVRTQMEMNHAKLQQVVTGFEKLPGAMEGMKADHGFCCLGTTIKTAGSKEKQYIIDHDYVVAFATGCHKAGVTRFAVVSSIGANAASSNFYLRTKGEMERDILTIPFLTTLIMQPSFLFGERKEFRAGEKTAISVMKVLNSVMLGPLKKYRGVQVKAVAGVMVSQVKSEKPGVTFIRSDEIC